MLLRINKNALHVCTLLFFASLLLSANASKADFNCELTETSAWTSGGTAAISITNTATQNAPWQLITVTFPEGITLDNVWGAQNTTGELANTYHFTPESWNATLAPNASATAGFQYSNSSNADISQSSLSGDCAIDNDNNLPPVAHIDVSAQTESLVTLFSNATDPDGDELTYRFFVDGSGWGAASTSPSVTSSMEKGTHEIKVVVSDGQLSSEATTTYTQIYPYDPTARLAVTTNGQTITVDGSESSSFRPHGHEDNSIQQYVWDFGDGNTGEGETATHTYAAEGMYSLSLTVTDRFGSDTETDVIAIGSAINTPPSVYVTCSQEELAVDDFNLGIGTREHYVRCTANATDAEDDALSYTFEFGDGSEPVTGIYNSQRHRYVNSGTYTVTVGVSDGINTTTASVDAETIGDGLPPEASITCDTNNLTVTCSYTTTGANSIRIYWSSNSYSDYTTVTDPTGMASNTYSEAGSYSVQIVVWNSSYIRFANTTVELSPNTTNTPPTIDLTCYNQPFYADYWEPTRWGYTTDFVRCQPNAEDADDDALTYTWEMNDGSAPIVTTDDFFKYAYANDGLANITLTVTDGIHTVTASVELEVIGNGVPPVPSLECTPSGLTITCDIDATDGDGTTPGLLFRGEWVEPGTYTIEYDTAGSKRVYLTARDSNFARTIQEIFVLQEPATTSCEYTIVGDWGTQFQGNITITNNSNDEVSGWQAIWEYTDGSTVTNVWNAQLTGSGPYTATNLDWNKNLQPGASVTIGFNGENGGASASMPVLSGSSCH